MLGKIGDPRAVEPLIRALGAPGHQTPLNAAQALGKIGDPRAIEPLLMLAANGRDKTREAALQALEKIGYSSADEPAELEEPLPTPEIN